MLVLEHLTGHPDGLGLTDICEALALPKSIGHRLLALLIESGYADANKPHTGRAACITFFQKPQPNIVILDGEDIAKHLKI